MDDDENISDVHFPITTRWEQGQAYFDQGIGQPHGFWYFEAERSFRQLAAEDPNCAIAYWGMAMANWENEARAKGFIEKASALIKQASPREQAYIKVQANYLDGHPADARKRGEELLRDLDTLVQDYPDDPEAKVFLVVRMWHMPGHTYSDLGRYADAAWHQQASARVDHAHMLEHRLLPDQIFNYAHNNEWLARLLPIARSLGFNDDWRLPYEPAPDFGERPDAATLGPLHWMPPPAPAFALPDKDGNSVSLDSYQG